MEHIIKYWTFLRTVCNVTTAAVDIHRLKVKLPSSPLQDFRGSILCRKFLRVSSDSWLDGVDLKPKRICPKEVSLIPTAA
jgi:hypothetical protein